MYKKEMIKISNQSTSTSKMGRKTGTIRLTCLVLAGVMIGYLAGNVVRIARGRCLGQILSVRQIEVMATVLSLFSQDTEQNNNTKFYTDKNLVLVAVMTTKNFLSTRAAAMHDTWVKTIPGEVIFFSSDGSENITIPGINVVGLRGVDDVYPPQKKSFLMLKHIHDHYLDKFRFFVRADDDVYIKGEELVKFLHSINSTGMPVIGSPGFGNKDEYGKLHLANDENYCMGGPGIILTREILAKTVPHFNYCIKNLYTTHEDVEIGRCIKKFANVTCTWSSSPNLFYHNYQEPKGSFTNSLWSTGIRKALTLHPVKLPTYIYRLHQHLLSLKAFRLRSHLTSLQRQVDAMNRLLGSQHKTPSHSLYDESPELRHKTIRRTADEVRVWDCVRTYLYSARREMPRMRLPSEAISAMSEIKEKAWQQMHFTALDEDRLLRRRNVKFLYSTVNGMQGHDYILELLTWPLNLAPENRTSVDAQFQIAYAHRSFLDVQFEEDINVNDEHYTNEETDTPSAFPVLDRPSASDGDSRSTTRSLEVKNKNEVNTDSKFGTFSGSLTRVNFILPLAGRYSMFLKFMQNFEDVCLKTNENVSLTIMLFRGASIDTRADVIAYVTRLTQTYSDTSLSVVLMSGNFLRGVALQNASGLFQDNDLLFFIDVDIEIQSSTLLRIRLNTVKGQMVYAPIVFSHYDPKYLPTNVSSQYPKDIDSQFDSDLGYWRQYGCGMVSTYKSDFQRSGGFRQSIQGWGLEDVDLLVKFISTNLSVFRSVDVGLRHRFHPIICDLTLKKSQYRMCIGTKVTTFASVKQLTEIVYQTPEILNRGDTT